MLMEAGKEWHLLPWNLERANLLSLGQVSYLVSGLWPLVSSP